MKEFYQRSPSQKNKLFLDYQPESLPKWKDTKNFE